MLRHLVIILGDQLNRDSTALQNFDVTVDAVWMAELSQESTHVRSHKIRIAVFLSAMRHFAVELKSDNISLYYQKLNDLGALTNFKDALGAALKKLHPQKVVVTEPGEWRVRDQLVFACKNAGIPLDIRDDDHFFCSTTNFKEFADTHGALRMEYFYRWMRKRTGILMKNDQPEGDTWNFDKENRGAFPKSGPDSIPTPAAFKPDAITREVIKLIELKFPNHPGTLNNFDWPMTRDEALLALDDFIQHRLVRFGLYQDAMWTEQPYLYHSRLSSALNLKLISPREVVQAAEQLYRERKAPLPAVEGFVRQILGWREYVRGVYWRYMPEYIGKNALKATAELPDFYWTGDTEMVCLKQTVGMTLQFGYSHHIQRLMVTGLYSLLLGVRPQETHAWYLAVYVDAIEWVELPNTLGMSQYGDGGIMASKPYVASGKYIQRMSNFCKTCVYDPAQAVGEKACPFTTLYWDFLMKHETMLSQNQRMSLQVKNLQRFTTEEKKAIQDHATAHRAIHQK